MLRPFQSATTLLAVLRRIGAGLLALLMYLQCAQAVQAAQAAQAVQPHQSAWVGDPSIAEARLLSAVTAVGNLDNLPLGLEIRIAPGWKVYWRTPGEAGLPPVLDFSQSSYPGITAALQWPAPTRFNAFGFDNFGYQDHVIFPLTITGHPAGSLMQLQAGLEALACSDICVPIAGDLALVLPDGSALPTGHARSIAEYAARVPRLANDAGIAASGRNLRVGDAYFADGTVTITMAANSPVVTDAFIEGYEQVAFRAPSIQGNMLVIPYEVSKNAEFTGGDGRITLVASGESGDFPLSILPRDRVAPSGIKSPAMAGLSLWALGIAFLGGLILNLMPCVLPVLAIKLSSVLDAIGSARAAIRWRFVAGAAGIMTSFLLLATILAVLKAGGASIGWGIQFQNIYFIGGMIAILGLFTANMLDLVTFRVPAFAQRLSRSPSRDRSSSLRADFLSGMLATILATPCSAPFVGTAVTIAFSGSLVDLFGIFFAMGLGLAAPWLLVALVPAAVNLLPKPGPWFKWLKAVLASMLIATMIWLGTILVTLVGGAGATPPDAEWQIWKPAAAAQLVADGKTVFVDVTADWCVTCKANKALVLDQPPVATVLADAVADGTLVMLQADWTRPNDDIAAFLASHARFGIPFNMILSPAYPDGILLPELLRADLVLAALEKAQMNPK